MREQINKVLESKSIKEMYKLLKSKKDDRELSCLIDFSLMSDYEVYLKYCIIQNFTIEDVETDLEKLHEYISLELKYDSVCEEFENYKENADDNEEIDYDEFGLIHYYRELEPKKYKEYFREEADYKELRFEDLDY